MKPICELFREVFGFDTPGGTVYPTEIDGLVLPSGCTITSNMLVEMLSRRSDMQRGRKPPAVKPPPPPAPPPKRLSGNVTLLIGGQRVESVCELVFPEQEAKRLWDDFEDRYRSRVARGQDVAHLIRATVEKAIELSTIRGTALEGHVQEDW